MQETGLLGKWLETTFNPKPTECLLKNKKNTGNHRITLKNLTSAFTLLIFGISVSFIVFVIELICRLYTFNSPR